VVESQLISHLNRHNISSLHISLVTVLKLPFLKLAMTYFSQWIRASCHFLYSLTYLQRLIPLTMLLLLHGLHHMFGIQGIVLSWLRSYLTKRFQIVSIQGTHCDQTELYCISRLSFRTHSFILYTQPLASVILIHTVSQMLYTDLNSALPLGIWALLSTALVRCISMSRVSVGLHT